MQRVSLAALLVLCAALTVAAAATAAVDPLSQVTGPTPFGPNCAGPQEGTLYRNAEVEPFVDVNPEHPRTTG